MRRPENLRTLAFRLAPQTLSLPYSFYTLTIPEHWRSALLSLQKTQIKRDQDNCTIPHRRLSEMLRALLPDLLFVEANGKAWTSGEAWPWLYAQEPTDAEALHIIVRAWAQTVFSGVSDVVRSNALNGLQATDLQWQKQTTDLATCGTAANGTASPASNAFRLLPSLLAAKFSKEEVELHAGNEPFRFRRALLEPGKSGVELISWPPRQYVASGKTWPYSLVLTLTVQTVPFQSYPFIYCDLSIRRWVGAANTSLPGGNTNVYILTEVPWIEGVHSYHSFQSAPIRWTHVPVAEQKPGVSEFRVVWANRLAELLDKLRSDRVLPNPQSLINNPLLSMNTEGSPSTMIVFRNGMKPKHPIGTGIPPVDRKTFAEQIARILEPEVVSAEPLTRIVVPAVKSSAPGAGNKNRQLVRRCVGEHVAIEIRYQTRLVHDALTRQVEAYFGLEPETKFPYQCAETGLTIHVHAKPLGEIGRRLDLPKQGSSTRERHHTAIKQRCAEVSANLTPASTPTGTLIELQDEEHFLDKSANKSVKGLLDPKHALRKAFAHVQRLTQFINTADEETDAASLEHRAKSSVLDLFRQLGVQESLPSLPATSGGSTVGLWMVKEFSKSSATRVQEKLPVMVHIENETGRVMAIAKGIEQWLPYRDLLLKVGRGEYQGIGKDKLGRDKHDNEALPFVRNIVLRDLSQGDTLLLCHSQNFRAAWPWLTDKNIAVDCFAFLVNEPLRPISTRPGLRIIRVRDSDANETPEWYSPYEDGTVTYTSGLFAAGERVFMGLNRKDSKFKHSRHLSMFQGYINKEGTAHGPAVTQNTPSATLCEITTACLQEGDDPASWAALTNNLRDAAIHYSDATALPLPLHLAKLVKEYVLPLAEDDDEQA